MEALSAFSLALVGPFLYAATNHIDKVLLSKYFKDGGVGTLILFSSLLSVIALPFVYLADRTVLDVDARSVLLLGGLALLDVALLWCYFCAIKDDEASTVITYYQLVPVFGLGFGFLFLGETITAKQLFAAEVILIGTTLLCFGIGKNIPFKLRTVGFMTLASLIWAFEITIFKAVALEENVWRSLFWKHVALVAVGMVIFTFVPSYRKHFVTAWKENSKAIIALNALNEILYIIATVAVAVAVVKAPVIYAFLAQTFQAVIVLLMAIVLTRYFPHISREDIDTTHLIRKFGAIGVTGVGTYLLFA